MLPDVKLHCASSEWDRTEHNSPHYKQHNITWQLEFKRRKFLTVGSYCIFLYVYKPKRFINPKGPSIKADNIPIAKKQMLSHVCGAQIIGGSFLYVLFPDCGAATFRATSGGTWWRYHLKTSFVPKPQSSVRFCGSCFVCSPGLK